MFQPLLSGNPYPMQQNNFIQFLFVLRRISECLLDMLEKLFLRLNEFCLHLANGNHSWEMCFPNLLFKSTHQRMHSIFFWELRILCRIPSNFKWMRTMLWKIFFNFFKILQEDSFLWSLRWVNWLVFLLLIAWCVYQRNRISIECADSLSYESIWEYMWGLLIAKWVTRNPVRWGLLCF